MWDHLLKGTETICRLTPAPQSKHDSVSSPQEDRQLGSSCSPEVLSGLNLGRRLTVRDSGLPGPGVGGWGGGASWQRSKGRAGDSLQTSFQLLPALSHAACCVPVVDLGVTHCFSFCFGFSAVGQYCAWSKAVTPSSPTAAQFALIIRSTVDSGTARLLVGSSGFPPLGPLPSFS